MPQLGRDLSGASAEETEVLRCLQVMECARRPGDAGGGEARREDGDGGAHGQAQAGGKRGQSSSNKMGRRRKKRKKRKKKLPKGSSSSFLHGLRGGAGDQGTLFEYVVDENVEVKGYSGRGGTAPCMEEIGFGEKVIRGREFIHKYGQPELTLFSDRLHLYSQSSERCWPTWMKDRRRYVRRVGYAPGWTDLLLTSADSQVCCEERFGQTQSTDATVKNFI